MLLTAKKRKERKAYNRAYRLAHKKKIAKQEKAYHLAHKKEIAEYHKAYWLANKEKLKAYDFAHKREKVDLRKARRRKHPEKHRVLNRKYRALKYGNNHEPYTGNYIFERDSWICGICGRKINKRLKHPNPLSKSIDHIVPLSKGGNDSPINVQAAHLRCNMLKSAQNSGQLRLIG